MGHIKSVKQKGLGFVVLSLALYFSSSFRNGASNMKIYDAFIIGLLQMAVHLDHGLAAHVKMVIICAFVLEID